ncbi:MAG TPA: cysteine desulfurase [Lacunisphaera sp.]|jgi:cysteine desulfurase/selenocysteine lyase|nr:cysteine desulfurase [Lacunisphaera sp.]
MNAAWKNIRADFPILDQQVNGRPLVYLDNAATSQKPRCVIDALSAYYLKDNANVHRGIHALSMRATFAYEAARERSAKFLNAAEPGEIVFTAGTTDSINLVANAWGDENLKAGDVILLTEMEHHSNLVPWQLLARRTGATLRYLPIVAGDTGLLDLAQLDKVLTRDVKLFAFTHVSNTLGVINPAAELCAAARKVGALTVVDAAQSAGHMPVDVRALGCDFLALSGHKMCGPTGVGILYGRKALLDAMPPYRGGGSMISNVEYFESKWAPAPAKFEAGTPNIGDVIALARAMDYLDDLGREAIAQHDEQLAALAYSRLKAEVPGIRILGPAHHRSGVVSFDLAGVHAHDVVTLADQEGVALRGGHHCNQPLMRKLGLSSTSRASFYLYNTEAEIDRLVATLRKLQKFFAS